MELNICHLYPDILNLYGDRGNIITMKRRLEARGMAAHIEECSIGQPLDIEAYDIFFIGGGQDFEQEVLLRDLADPKYSKWYPLMEWGWDRNRCIQEIQNAGLPLPGKSSCFFCPSMKRREIRTLYHRYPDLLARALAIEDRARPNLLTVRGLGRNYAWRDFIEADQAQLAIPGVFSSEDLPCSCVEETEEVTRKDVAQDGNNCRGS